MPFIPLKIGVVTDTANHYKSRFQLTDEQCGELSSQVQVDATIDALKLLGHQLDFIGSVFELVQRLAQVIPGQKAPWDLVFNAAEGIFGTAREAQVPALLEAYRIPFTFADAGTMVVGLDKALAEDQEVVFASFPLFIKPNAEGSYKGINENSKINCIDDIRPAIDRLAIQYPDQDLLIETFLSGRECSVAILGSQDKARVLGTINSIIDKPTPGLPSIVDGRKMGKITAADFLTYEDKVESGKLCTDEHIDTLGMRDYSRIDVRDDEFRPDAKPYVIEANAIPGLVQDFSTIYILASNHGMSYVKLINNIVKSARERVK